MHRFSWVAFVSLMVGVTGCDHATKRLAATELQSRALGVWPHVLELRVAHNTDSAFSLLGDTLSPHARWILLSVLASAVTLGALVFIVRRWKDLDPMARLGGALVISGGLGNVYDRLLTGHVIDFIHVEHWPIFNVADIAVTLGVLALVWSWKGHRPAPSGGAAEP